MVTLTADEQAALERLRALDDLEIVIETDDGAMERKYGLGPSDVLQRVEAVFADLDFELADATDGAPSGYAILVKTGEDDDWGSDDGEIGSDIDMLMRAASTAKLPS